MQAPYPADTRAKGWRFELDMERARQSDTWTLASPEVRPWLLMMWAVAWEQTPCGSMPADDELIAARLGMPPKLFAKHRAILMRRWWLADDGRYYHDVMVQRVTEMMERRRKESDRKALARAKRDAGLRQTPEAVPHLSRGTTAGTPWDSTHGATPEPEPEPEVNHTEDFNGRSASARETGAEDDPPPFVQTKAGEIGMALKRGGIDPLSLNLSDSRLAALIAQGATPEEFEGLAREAVAAGIARPFPWVMVTLAARRQDAARIRLAPAGQNRQQALESRNRAIADEWAQQGIA